MKGTHRPGVGLCQERQRAGLEKQMTARQLPLNAYSTLTHLSSFDCAKHYSRANYKEFTLSFFQIQAHFCTSACLCDQTHTDPYSCGSWIPFFLPTTTPVLVSQPLTVALPT